MGRAKELMIEHQENIARAAAYLVHVGRLEQCEIHGEIYDGGFFELESEFWRDAMADRNLGYNGPVPWAADFEGREFTDLLKQAYENYCGDCCGFCEKNAAD